MPDIMIFFLVGGALGFGVGYAVRERMSRRRRRHARKRTSEPPIGSPKPVTTSTTE
jgi:hypothetical protein